MLGKGAFITTHMAIMKISLGLWKKLVYKIKERFYGWSKCQNLVQSNCWRNCLAEKIIMNNWSCLSHELNIWSIDLAQSVQIAQIAKSAQKCPKCPKVPKSAQKCLIMLKKVLRLPRLPESAQKCPECPNLPRDRKDSKTDWVTEWLTDHLTTWPMTIWPPDWRN